MKTNEIQTIHNAFSEDIAVAKEACYNEQMSVLYKSAEKTGLASDIRRKKEDIQKFGSNELRDKELANMQEALDKLTADISTSLDTIQNSTYSFASDDYNRCMAMFAWDKPSGLKAFKGNVDMFNKQFDTVMTTLLEFRNQFRDCNNQVDDDNEKQYDKNEYMKIITKNQYVTLRAQLRYFTYDLFRDKDVKIKSDDVALLVGKSLQTVKHTFITINRDNVRKFMVDIATNAYFRQNPTQKELYIQNN